MALIINVKSSDSYETIQVRVLTSLRLHLDKAMRQAAPAIRARIQELCVAMIKDTEEYDSLVSGELLAELGIPEVERRLRQILDGVRKGVDARAEPVVVRGGRLAGGLSISMVRSSFEDLLGLPAAEYVSNGRYVIPWLRWLIVEGDRVIILTHEVTFNLSAADRARSRTGMALMRPGSGWRVPPEYSGTLDDNFITRAFKGNAIREHVSNIVREEIQRRV